MSNLVVRDASCWNVDASLLTVVVGMVGYVLVVFGMLGYVLLPTTPAPRAARVGN
jgi:hypothetical protein